MEDEKNGHVTIYFIQHGHYGPVKVGKTKNSPEKRLVQLQTAAPHKLRLLCHFKGEEDLEAILHRRLSDTICPATNEWYYFTERLDPIVQLINMCDGDYEKIRHMLRAMV